MIKAPRLSAGHIKISSDVWAFFGILFFLFVFYPELFFIKAGPFSGDHLEQHYPWAHLLSQSLKQFKLPFWLPLIQCGFPIAAESQIAIFYLPNLFMYFFFPFHAAYSYMNLVHWLIAGWGTYRYARQMKLSAIASFLAAFLFIFGSAYGGGYYNMTSLKTICWFPVGLYFLEKYLEKRKWYFLFGLALVISQSLVAGYLQMAVLTWLIFGVYAVLRIFVFSETPLGWTKKLLLLGPMMSVAILALIFAWPQLYLTFRLAVLSNRIGLEEGYAYVGSASPLVLGTLLNPSLWPLVKGNLYTGLFSLFLVFVAFTAPKFQNSKTLWIWGLITIFAFLLALGQWSPLYVALIKVTKFYSFRIPAKFLGFCGFGLAMLSAVGFEALWRGRSTPNAVKKAFYVFVAAGGSFVAVTIFMNLFLTLGKEAALKMGHFFVMRFVYAKPGHPLSLEAYLAHLEKYPEQILRFLSFREPVNIWMFVMLGFCLVLLILLKSRTVTKPLLSIGLLFLAIDLYAVSYVGMKPNFALYETALAPSPILEILKQEKEGGRVGRVYGFRSRDRQPPFISGRYMLDGIESIGAYSPLVSRRYFESIGLLGNINDSNYQEFPSLPFVLERLPLLSFLNVSHMVSTEPMEHPDLKLMKQEDRLSGYLYKNRGTHQPAYFMSRLELVQTWDDLREKLMAPGFDPRRTLLLEQKELEKLVSFDREVRMDPAAKIRLEKRRDDFEEWLIETDQAGFFVISETFFPGWTVTVNGQSAPLLKAYGLFRAVKIDGPGRYQIQFRYQPFR